MGDLSEEEAEEILEKAEELEEEYNIETIEQAREVVESESNGFTENQKDALTTVVAGGAVVTGSLFGPAGIVASGAAAGYVANESGTIFEAYKDGAGQVKEIINNLKNK